MKPSTRMILMGQSSTPAALFKRLTDPSKSAPAFVDLWSVTDFNGVVNSAPSASGIGTDGIGQLSLEYTVSGAANATSLTISAGDESKGTGSWGGVIQHDDGTYGLYTITSLAAGVCSIFPALRATTTAKTLRNLAGGVNGQHYTEPGYKALARAIFATTKMKGYRSRYAAKWTAATGVKADWTAVGGLGAGQYSLATSNAATTLGWTGRGTKAIEAIPSAPYTGKGVSRTFYLNTASAGYMEAAVACYKTPDGFAAFRLKLVIDGVTISDESYPSKNGLTRISIPHTGGAEATVTITRDDETAAAYTLRIGDVTFWTYDRSQTWTDPLIDKNGKVVLLGDSWSAFYASVLASEIGAAMTAAGGSGSCVSVGVSGMTSEWGLANFDALVAPQAPTQVLVEFFTNDHNSFGLNDSDRWLRALYRIGLKCQQLGVQPIFLLPLPTASFSQAVNHGIWAERIGLGRAE